jgi:hypothetical protein
MPAFEGALRKIERANKHISEVKAVVASFPEFHTSSVEINPEPPGNEAIKHDISNREKLVSDLALQIGDAVHNLKCALDYAWIGAIERFAPSALGNFAKFPVRHTEDELKAALIGREIDFSAPALFNRIVSDIQPYEGGNDSIWSIHKLDILDKHRLLIPIVEFAAISGIEVENERGEIERNGFTWITPQKAPFYVPVPPGWHVRSKGELTSGIFFDEGTPVRGMDVPDMLATFSIQALNVVELLQYL